MHSILINAIAIRRLDLSPLRILRERSLKELLQDGTSMELKFEWPRETDDPRELSECPEPRLWAIRSDANFPFLPMLLEKENGTLIRHIAMLVPHTFNKSEGLKFDSQALEIWITHRFMHLDDLYGDIFGKKLRDNLSQLSTSLGYEINNSFWNLLN